MDFQWPFPMDFLDFVISGALSFAPILVEAQHALEAAPGHCGARVNTIVAIAIVYYLFTSLTLSYKLSSLSSLILNTNLTNNYYYNHYY